MKNKFYVLSFLLIALFGLNFTSCKNKSNSIEEKTSINEFNTLIDFLETNENYVNSKNIPANIDAVKVFESLNNNILILDIRNKESFVDGHIKGALNIMPDSLISFFDNIIEPNSFDSIIFVCDIGVRSAFVTGIFRLLGYKNVFSMKFGMSAWNMQYAEALWLKNLSSHLESELEINKNPLPQAGSFPNINTGKTTPYEILKARAQLILSDTIQKYFIDIDKVINNNYFIIKYWNENLDKLGQLKGSVRFTPKKSLHSKADLNKIPVDKPVLLYCFSGTHGSFVVAYLRILGYEAYSLKYGTNAFMYNTLLKNSPDHSFSKDQVNNFPIETSLPQIQLNQESNSTKKQIKGGC